MTGFSLRITELFSIPMQLFFPPICYSVVLGVQLESETGWTGVQSRLDWGPKPVGRDSETDRTAFQGQLEGVRKRLDQDRTALLAYILQTVCIALERGNTIPGLQDIGGDQANGYDRHK